MGTIAPSTLTSGTCVTSWSPTPRSHRYVVTVYGLGYKFAGAIDEG